MTLFTVENQAFGWDELIIAAQLWGEWQPFFEQTRQALACLRQVAKTGEMPPAAAMREAVTAFRYAHNLISAEETRVWLQRWQVKPEDWMNYLQGQLLRQRWAARLDEITAAHRVSDAEVAEVFKSYAVCADKLSEWAIKLAGRAAVTAGDGGLDAAASGSALITRIEAEFERLRQTALTPKRIARKIMDNQLDWVRFDCRYLWFSEERRAREAAWCVKEDGLILDEVAADAHCPVRQWQVYADEIEADVRSHFLAARVGELLGPLQIRQGFGLFALVKKRLPADDDPQIRARAERAITTSFTEQAIRERVKWAAR